jgi:hypothetical protein
MTTYTTQTVTCSICRTPTEHHGLMSTNEHGSRDLDLRPASMMRETMNSWVQHCPECGLCAASLDKAPAGAAQAVRTSEYRGILNDPRFPALAIWFRAESFLTERAGDLATAANRALCAAWTCDDAELVELAIECRTGAIALFLRASGGNGHAAKNAPDPDTLNLILTDLLRRTRRFDEARARCQQVLHASSKLMQAVARYQLALLSKEDTAAHRIDEAVRN